MTERDEQMREFRIDNTVKSHGLTHSISTTNTDLKPYVESFIVELHQLCGKIPVLDYSVEWGVLPATVLASTWTSYRSANNMWVPSNSFKIVFNPRFRWWDGTCSSKPAGHYDLKSTVMHEVLHGLGYVSTISRDKTAWPSKFDLLLRDSAGSMAVVGGNFVGNFGDKLYIEHVRMYNPSTYNSGSSFSHEHKSALLMSHSQTKCRQQLDQNTAIILNHFGYQCSVNATRLSIDATISPVVFYVIGAFAAFVLFVCICKSRTGRKKRDLSLQPLLS